MTNNSTQQWLPNVVFVLASLPLWYYQTYKPIVEIGVVVYTVQDVAQSYVAIKKIYPSSVLPFPSKSFLFCLFLFLFEL